MSLGITVEQMGTKGIKGGDWHPEDVKAAIRKAGASMVDLARRNGLSGSAVKRTLFRRSPPVQSIIAAHLGLPPWKIWPSRYDALQQPIDLRRSGASRNARGRAGSQRQIGGEK